MRGGAPGARSPRTGATAPWPAAPRGACRPHGFSIAAGALASPTRCARCRDLAAGPWGATGLGALRALGRALVGRRVGVVPGPLPGTMYGGRGRAGTVMGAPPPAARRGRRALPPPARRQRPRGAPPGLAAGAPPAGSATAWRGARGGSGRKGRESTVGRTAAARCGRRRGGAPTPAAPPTARPPSAPYGGPSRQLLASAYNTTTHAPRRRDRVAHPTPRLNRPPRRGRPGPPPPRRRHRTTATRMAQRA
jgi:hypothetical protein